MIEKYFEVTKDSGLYEEYSNYLENSIVLNKAVKNFMLKHNMETNTYACEKEKIYIQPTQKDKEIFKSQLCSYCNSQGLYSFKKNSKIGKDWIAQKVVVIYRPYVGLYFQDCCGHTSSRIFKIKEKVYCSFKNEYDTMETPEGFTEMKASEFFKIIEDNENK